MGDGTNAVFQQLKPICDSIATKPSLEQLCKLRELISTHDKNIIQTVFEYVLFPVYMHLENENRFKNDLKQALIDTLKCLLEVVTVKKVPIMFRICVSLTKQIMDRRTSTIKESTDEELRLSVINCLTVLFSRLSPDVVSELYCRNNIIHFSQTFFLCVQILKTDKMRDLKLSAINCIMAMFYVHDEADFADIVLRKQVADTTMFYLPGITIALRNTALDDEKQGHKITFMAIRALARVIVLQMAEYDPPDISEILIEFPLKEEKPKVEILTDEKSKEVTAVALRPNNVEIMKNALASETKTKDWFSKTSENLRQIIASLMPLQCHYHENVRLELSDFCHQILLDCSKSLECCLMYCIEMLISLSEDDHSFVAEKSKSALGDLSNYCKNITFFDILSDNFYEVITRMPRTMMSADTKQHLSALSLLGGYIRLLGPNHLCKILQSSNQLQRFIQCLVFICLLEKTHATLFEEHAIRDFESISATTINWKQFKYINEPSHLKKIQAVLRSLAESNALVILIDYLCTMFRDEFEQRNEVVFILNEMFSVELKDVDNQIEIVSDLIKMYIAEDEWYLSTNVDHFTRSEIHFHIIQMCLLVEGLGNMATGLGIDYKQFLLKTLYIVLERAGSAQPLLSTAGLSAIVKISKACKYENVTDLIVKNTDYFSFHVVKRLTRLDQAGHVLNVLNVVMKYSTIEVLPSIMEIIDGVLLHSFDKFQERNLSSFLQVFYSFVTNLKRWLNISLQSDSKTIQLLKEYKKNMDVFYVLYDDSDYKGEMTDDSSEECSNEEMQRNDELKDVDEDGYRKIEPPVSIKLTVKVLKRSLHFLPSKDLERKLLILRILKEGVEIISPWEDELLPIVHQIWSPLVLRLKYTEEPLEINQSFELLIILAKLSKDFIRNRTSKEVFPEICKTLYNLANKSYLKDRGAAYRYTQSYKLQLNMLNTFAQLITNLDMSSEDVSLAISAAIPYLSCNQPLPLQESTIQFIQTLACYDFETVWLRLIELWGPEGNLCEEESEKNTEIALKSLEVMHW